MATPKRTTQGLVFTLFFLSLFNGLAAQEVRPKGIPLKSLFDQIQAAEVKYLQISTNVGQLSEERKKYKYQEAKAVFTFANGDTIQEALKLRARGKFRNRFCELPPFKLKFSNRSLSSRNLTQLNELKVVIPCQRSRRFTTWIHKEYLVYRMYNLISAESFRTQLVDIVFEDMGKSNITKKLKAFLIEDKEELANRLNTEVYEGELSPLDFNQEIYKRFQVFQFLIGNTDWITTTGHNAEIFKSQELGIFPVPFDFDFSGIVGTFYAAPKDKLPISSVKERYFLGNYSTLAPLEATFSHFREKKEALIQLVSEFDLLPKGEKKSMIKYIESFYDLLDDPKQLKAYFVHQLAGPRANHY